MGRGCGVGDKAGGSVEGNSAVVVEEGIAGVPGCMGVGVDVAQAVRNKTRINNRFALRNMDFLFFPLLCNMYPDGNKKTFASTLASSQSSKSALGGDAA